MRRAIILSIIAMVLLSTCGAVAAQGEDNSASLKELIARMDSAVVSLRKGENSGAVNLISEASGIYSEKFSSRVAGVDNELDNRIRTDFISLSASPTEENIFALRSAVLGGAGKIGVYLPITHGLSLFIILAISIIISLLVTLLNRKMVNWNLVREAKAKLREFQEQYKEASRKKNLKLMHQLQQKQAEVMRLQGDVVKQTMKPTLIYMLPLMMVWVLLMGTYSGWVVAWLPFGRIDIPFLGPVVAFGVGWWYFITYLGFSQVFRKILIRD
ncbi:MAG: EMC3/TMCO1 family protein [Candidatus Hadarchaeales archaeon]